MSDDDRLLVSAEDLERALDEVYKNSSDDLSQAENLKIGGLNSNSAAWADEKVGLIDSGEFLAAISIGIYAAGIRDERVRELGI